MNRTPRILSLLAVAASSLPFAGAEEIDFAHQIVPLLKAKCAECHAGDKKKGGFSFNTRAALLAGGEDGAVVVPGRADASKLMKFITSTDPDEQMPPKGERLAAKEVALLKAWIDSGLAWEEGFAFKKPNYEPPLKPRKPALPAATNGRTNPLDQIIEAYLAAKKLPTPAPIDDATFLRRISLDLQGLLPAPEKLQEFLADKSPDKRARVIDELLSNDTAYAEHWLTFWNDLLRNDYDGTGFITGGRTQITKWLYAALIANKPYDQFTRELIAPPNGDSNGFINGIRWRGEVSAGQTVEIQFAQSISQSLLGINMKCASCHDSFIDRWKLDEAYGLAAIYSNTQLDISRCDKPTGRKASAAWLFPELGQVDAKAPQPERLKQLAALMTHPENGRFTRTITNRLWKQLMGRGIVHPVDAMQTEPWNADLLDFLATHLAESKYDLKATLRLIANSQAYQSRCEEMSRDSETKAYIYAGPRAKRLSAEQFLDCLWQITGTPQPKIDAPVTRGKPPGSAGKGAPNNASQAQWIWGDSAKPGASPPANEVIALQSKFSLAGKAKSAVAIITCDNEYQLFLNGKLVGQDQAWESVESFSIAAQLVEGENVVTVLGKNAGAGNNAAGLLFEVKIVPESGGAIDLRSDGTWKFTADKLEVQDSKLSQNATAQWKDVIVVPELDAWRNSARPQFASLASQPGGANQLASRAALLKCNPLMRSLGRPNRDQIVTARSNDLTTLEAMDLANGKSLAEIISAGAGRLMARNFPNTESLVHWLYTQALSRAASAEELAIAQESMGPTLSPKGIEDLIWAVIVQPEFLLVR